MQRETSNRIRYFIEEILPPALRDSALFRWSARQVWGDHIDRLANFRARAPFLSAEEYEALYRLHPRIHEGTDNSEACLQWIARDVIGPAVCDVGCGTGALLRRLCKVREDLTELVGVDIVVDQAPELPEIRYVAAPVEQLPFPDANFDTVVCTHVIEHILDYRQALSELRRITRRRLIIVVPREREGLYTFNPHFNFFPYTHAFLRAMHPVPQDHECCYVGRDIYYREDRSA